ncbi:LysE family transporter [Salinimonas marina]|uniref:LysE family transporter n=1 Tax=Salinimonas marina TaxID=2785918 RepID=A0A7S9DV34_9ALTE|nr:LysE family transporter [Salinimonas marina]QPG04448.1 LysE family transporter [Salinimonas marina]
MQLWLGEKLWLDGWHNGYRGVAGALKPPGIWVFKPVIIRPHNQAQTNSISAAYAQCISWIGGWHRVVTGFTRAGSYRAGRGARNLPDLEWVALLCGQPVRAMIAAGMGLAVLFATFAGLKLAFQIAGGLFMVYVAWELSSAPASSNNVREAAKHAPSLVNGLTLSVLNPKAYIAFMATFSQFMLPFSSASMSLALTGFLCLLLVVVIDFVGLSCGRLIAPSYRAILSRWYCKKPAMGGLYVFGLA